MGITVAWQDAEKTALRWTFEGKWTWEEYYKALDQNNALLDAIDNKVDLIINMENTNHVPPGYVSQFRRIAQFHPQVDFAILIMNNRFIEIMLNMLVNFQPEMRWRVIAAPSLEKGLQVKAERLANKPKQA
jgi:hypothetical protein